jgi:YggT family protein
MTEEWNKETPDRRESVHVTEDSTTEHRERVVTDAVSERKNVAYTATQLIWLLFGILIGMIGLRILLMLIGANPANPFANFVYSFTDLFLWPFAGLTGSPGVNGMVLDIPAIIAIFVYALLAWVIVKIVRIIVYRPTSSSSVETYRRDRH